MITKVEETIDVLNIGFKLMSIQAYLKNPSSVTGRSILPRASTRKRMAVDRVRRHFSIPNYIPYSQFKRYLKVLERRLELQLKGEKTK